MEWALHPGGHGAETAAAGSRVSRHGVLLRELSVWQYGNDMVKVTFTLDDETVERLRLTAARLRKPQSQVVREAVAEYAAAAGRLSETERRTMLEVFDRVVAAVPRRPAREVDQELREIRVARRRSGRRTASRR